MAYIYTESATPSGWRGSTYLNPSVRSYDNLLTRVKIQLGFPVLNIEALDCMIYDNISISIEKYSRYAGFTEEYLVFNSDQYERGWGIEMDKVVTSLGPTYKTTSESVSGRFYDYDLEDYRKVINVFTFDSQNTSSMSGVFDLQYVYASQAYFNTMQNGSGFDLVTWHNLQEFFEMRKKTMGLMIQCMFDKRSQRLRLIPEPTGDNAFTGVIGCYIERPIRELICEPWVFEYALSLTKIQLGHIRGKFGAVSLAGGSSINWNDITSQGLEERARLELDLMKPGDAPPLQFFIG